MVWEFPRSCADVSEPGQLCTDENSPFSSSSAAGGDSLTRLHSSPCLSGDTRGLSLVLGACSTLVTLGPGESCGKLSWIRWFFGQCMSGWSSANVPAPHGCTHTATALACTRELGDARKGGQSRHGCSGAQPNSVLGRSGLDGRTKLHLGTRLRGRESQEGAGCKGVKGVCGSLQLLC